MTLHEMTQRATTAALEGAKDVLPATAAVGATTVGGATMGVPTWLLGLGQAVIVVYFTIRGVERRLRARDAERDRKVNELSGEVQTLSGRLNGLACYRAAMSNPAITPVNCGSIIGSE